MINGKIGGRFAQWLIRSSATAIVVSPAAFAGSVSNADEIAGPQLEEVVVTAQKRTENLQDVPITVAALSEELLSNSGITNSLGLSAVVPGLQTVDNIDNLLPHIRGVGNTATGPGIENSVATYVDGVYYGAAPGDLLNISNIQQVEVLKGPQGTLFGRNATGGLIQVTTKDPSHSFGVDAGIGYSNYQTSLAHVYVTGGLSDSVAANLSAEEMRQGEGWGRDLADGGENDRLIRQLTLRSKLLFTPSTGTSVKLIGDYSQSGDTMGTLRSPPGIAVGFPTNIGYVQPPSLWDTDTTFPTRNTYRGGGISGDLEQELGFARLVSISAFRENQFTSLFDIDGGPVAAEQLSLVLRDQQFTQEVQLLSPAGTLIQWVGGVFFINDNYGTEPSTLTLSGPLVDPAFPLSQIVVDSTGNTKSIAGFAQATGTVATDTHLTAGVRYTSEKRSLIGSTNGFLEGGIPIGPLDPNADQSKSFSKVTWRLALDHKFSEAIMGYISDNRGFKSGGFNTGIPNDSAFSPEVLDAYEIGLKSDLLDRHLRANASVFYYDYQDIQVARFETGEIGIYNGAKARIYGLDFDTRALIGDSLSLDGGLEYLHDRFTSFPNATGSVPFPGGGFTLLPGGTGPGVDATGNELPYAPTITGFVSVTQSIPTPYGKLDFNVSDSWNSGYYGEADNFLHQSGYDLLSASLTLNLATPNLKVKVWGSNLLNKAVASELSTLPVLYAAAYANPPRQFGISLNYSFGE